MRQPWEWLVQPIARIGSCGPAQPTIPAKRPGNSIAEKRRAAHVAHEALEQQIYREAAFGIVLMTPDDYGYPKAKGEVDRQPRARQNVVLEMGMVFASLGRDRMVILKKRALEIPSDIDGVLRLEFNDHVKEVGVRLATRMKNAGIEIDDSLIHRVGV
jgi:predicted nucleotide-binding protein